MSYRSIVISGAVVIVIVAVAIVVAGFAMDGHDAIEPIATTSTTTDQISAPSPIASTTPAYQDMPFPTDKPSRETASWKIYVDEEDGFSIEYPPNWIASGISGMLTIVVPKGSYFRWPLQDDVKITVVATSTCPKAISGHAEGESPAPVGFVLHGREWTRTIGTDIGAGNRYLEIAYDAVEDGVCYHASLLDRGANGAGLYVDDPALVAKYDKQHEADLSAVISIWSDMVGSLRILAAPR